VLGIKPESRFDRPAFFVPSYLAEAGFEILPVPVYYPDVGEILGRPVFRTVSAIPGPVDIVNVFRRPEHIPQHVPDLIAKRPRAVWFQSGIRQEEAAQALAKAGILVIQDRCIMVEHRRLVMERPG
jgi:predicted CoA-binding protein